MDIILVDENDREIGSGEYKKAKFSDIYRVSGLWVTNSKDEVLLAQRKLDKLTDPGKWGPAVAGTIEVGETYESNVYKEAEEEIGLTGFKFNIGPKVFNDANPDRKFFVQWFTCSCDWPVEKFKIQEDEVEKVEWSSETQLVQRLKEQPDQFIVGAEKVWQALLA